MFSSNRKNISSGKRMKYVSLLLLCIPIVSVTPLKYTPNIFLESVKTWACHFLFNPNFPLDPSFPRRRESSKKNNPRSGQSPEVDLLCRGFSMNWIPAFAGMTKFRANGKSGFNNIRAVLECGTNSCIGYLALSDKNSIPLRRTF
jgi:hypothetical protein